MKQSHQRSQSQTAVEAASEHASRNERASLHKNVINPAANNPVTKNTQSSLPDDRKMVSSIKLKADIRLSDSSQLQETDGKNDSINDMQFASFNNAS